MRLSFPMMRPIYWMLLAIAFGVAGMVEAWLIVNVYLPLAESRPGIIYYPDEDRIFVDNIYQTLKCDADHRLTDTIPLGPPLAFKRIKPEMLYVCDKPGQERKWIFTLTTNQEIQEALDHIERLALWRDRKILGGLGLLAGLPIIFCLAAALANRRRK